MTFCLMVLKKNIYLIKFPKYVVIFISNKKNYKIILTIKEITNLSVI